MRMLTLATFNDKEKAEAVRIRLEQYNIRAQFHDDSRVQRYWFMTKPLAWAKVRVPEKDYQRGLEILKQLDITEGILNDAVRCPQCGSCRIEYPQTTRQFFVPTLVEVVFSTNLVPKEYYCRNCQYTWPAKFEPQPADWGGEEVDTLGWKRDKVAALKD